MKFYRVEKNYQLTNLNKNLLLYQNNFKLLFQWDKQVLAKLHKFHNFLFNQEFVKKIKVLLVLNQEELQQCQQQKELANKWMFNLDNKLVFQSDSKIELLKIQLLNI